MRLFRRKAPPTRTTEPVVTRGIKGVRPAEANVETLLRDVFGSGAAGLVPADAVLRTTLTRLRVACRREYAVSDWARAIVQSARHHVIGPKGLQLRLDDRYADVEAAWRDHSRRGMFDVSGTLSRADCEQLVVHALYVEGEQLVRFADGGMVELIDPARLAVDVHHDVPRRGVGVVMGVEFDLRSRRVIAYHVDEVTFDRGSYFLTYSRRPGQHAERIDADEALLVFQRETAEQLRGRPMLATAIPRVRQLRHYENAELQSATLAANRVGFIQRSPEGGGLGTDAVDADGTGEVDPTVGGFLSLDAGAEAHIPDWGRPSEHFPAFQRANLLGMAAGTGTPYTELGGVAEANFSSIRAERIAVQEAWRDMQDLVRTQFTEPTFRRWLRDAMLRGIVRTPMTRYRDVLDAAEFVGRGWDHVQPREQAGAEAQRLENGTVSRQELIRESGRDPRTVMAAVAADQTNQSETGA